MTVSRTLIEECNCVSSEDIRRSYIGEGFNTSRLVSLVCKVHGKNDKLIALWVVQYQLHKLRLDFRFID